MNILKFLNLLSFVIWCSGAVAQPMYCDDMLRRGLNTPEQMKGCLVRQTPQQVRPLNSNLNVIQPTLQQPPPLNSNLNVNLPAPPATNIETKFFSDEELLAASSGKSLFAISEGFEGSNFLSTRLTDGNVLCAYLGYEVATKSTISSKLTFEETRKGVIVKSGLGGGARRPEFFVNDDKNLTLRKYISITCQRRKDRTLKDSEELLKKVVEELEILPDTGVRTN